MFLRGTSRETENNVRAWRDAVARVEFVDVDAVGNHRHVRHPPSAFRR